MNIAEPNVLLVDDDPSILEFYSEVLRPLGVNLVITKSGEEALERFQEAEFAVILLDIQLPGMDGYETALRIRSLENERQTPVIFATASYRDEQSAARGYALGAADYLLKPFQPEALLSKVTAYVELYRRTRTVMEKMNAVLPVAWDKVLVCQPDLAAYIRAGRWVQLPNTEYALMATAQEALAFLQKEETALVVLGTRLADRDGFELTQTLHQDERYSSIPIMLVAGAFATEEELKRGYNAGAVEVLTMPVSPSAFRVKALALLNQFKQMRTKKQQFREIERLKAEVQGLRKRLQEIEDQIGRLTAPSGI